MERIQGVAGKKLTAWVRWYYAADGYGPRQCLQCQEDRGEPTYCDDCSQPALLPENAEAAHWYSSISALWLRDWNGRKIRLDYAAIEADLRMSGREVTPDDWQSVKEIERAVLLLQSEKQKQQ